MAARRALGGVISNFLALHCLNSATDCDGGTNESFSPLGLCEAFFPPVAATRRGARLRKGSFRKTFYDYQWTVSSIFDHLLVLGKFLSVRLRWVLFSVLH
eukprot:5440804-Amphidinium_carterae.1